MRGRAAVFFLLLISSFPAFPQCSWTPRESSNFRITAYDVAVHGEFVWLATGYGVRLFDAATMTVADDLPLPGITRVVHADNRPFLYAGSGSRLYVLRREDRTLSVVRFVEAAGTINAILPVGSYLFVGTANGLQHFDVIDPATPIATGPVLFTSASNVTSLATAGGKLYAADGDATVDVFTVAIPSLPQRTGELATVTRASDVHVANDGMVFVSDAFGQNTDLFSDTTRLARLPFGSNAYAASAAGVHFVAGPDRTLRAVDLSSPTTLKELFEHQLPPTGGTENVIHDIVRANDRVYVAAGDIGLAVFDVSSIAPPYPLVSYRTTATSSTAMSGDRAWFADGSGTISEQRIVTTGIALTPERTWPGGQRVHDVEGTSLLASTNADATLWSLSPPTPSSTQTTTFRSNVQAAGILGQTIVALLVDGSVWTGGATPQQVNLPAISFMARAGTASIFVELRGDGTTVLHYFNTTDLSATPTKFTIAGIATGGVALDATRAAIFTFRGVEVLNLAGGGSVIAGSDRVIPQQLAFAGDDLLVLDRRRLYVYDRATTLFREHPLPADAIAIDAQPQIVVAATSEGMLAASYRAAQQPAATLPFASSFYSKVVSGENRAYLFAASGIDVFSTFEGDSPHYVTTVSAAGVIDVAATGDMLFTLTASGNVTSYSRHGTVLRQTTINEGLDAQMRTIDVAGNAVWVSLSKGCLSGECQEKTLVLDPVGLGITSSMNGSVIDVAASGNRAYAIFDLPDELRVIDITDPLHPSSIVSVAAPVTATSVAARSGHVFVLGDKLYDYAESTLLLSATHFAAVTPDKAQQIRIDGNCLVITARGPSPELYTASVLASLPSFDVPGPVRSIALQPGRLLVLTSHSLEVWSSVAPVPRKRRSSR